MLYKASLLTWEGLLCILKETVLYFLICEMKFLNFIWRRMVGLLSICFLLIVLFSSASVFHCLFFLLVATLGIDFSHTLGKWSTLMVVYSDCR